MHEAWFNSEWATFRDRAFVTPESFDPNAADFNTRLDAPDIPRATRINYPLDQVDGLGKIILGEAQGKQFYARSGMPGERELARLLVEAEAGYAPTAHAHVAASVFPSGMSAISNVAMRLVAGIPPTERAEVRFLTGDTIYYHANLLFDEELPALTGIGGRIKVNTQDPAAVREALEANKGKIIALVYESATNPLVEYTDTRTIATIAHEFNVPVIVDNTFLTPHLQQPMRMGADVVVHSMTKYMSGQGDMLAGAVVGPRALVQPIRHFQEVTGAIFQTPELIGRAYDRLRTLGLRMDVHAKNAATLADFLRNQCTYVSQVNAPALGAATRYGSPGAVLSFVMAGQDDGERQRREAGLIQYVIDHGRDTVHHMVSLGDAEHLIFGETTHGLGKGNFPAGLVRFAVGRTPDIDQVKDFLGNAFVEVYRSG